MKPNRIYTFNNLHKIPNPRQEGEIAVSARLLYPFVVSPHLPYEGWEESLRLMVAERGHIPRFRILIGDDGKLALNFCKSPRQWDISKVEFSGSFGCFVLVG